MKKMIKNELVVTAEGFLELEAELEDLKTNKRPEIIVALKEARALGDLSENAEYDAARTSQAEVEGRITKLEYLIDNAKIIDSTNKEEVTLGATVIIDYVEDNEEAEFKIVGSLEANPNKNKISNESPIGKAIMNKKIGDIIAVESPNGSYNIKIKKIA